MATPEQVAAYFAAHPERRPGVRKDEAPDTAVNATVTLIQVLISGAILLGIAKLILFVWGL